MYIENRRQYSWPGSAFFPRFLGNRTPLLLFSVMWSRAVLGLFSNNVVSFSRNLVLKSLLFSINVVRKWAMFLGQGDLCSRAATVRKAGTRALLGAV